MSATIQQLHNAAEASRAPSQAPGPPALAKGVRVEHDGHGGTVETVWAGGHMLSIRWDAAARLPRFWISDDGRTLAVPWDLEREPEDDVDRTFRAAWGVPR